ncbi:amino acid permease [Alicyclobacillus ferrooxydans]|uniref:Arginine:ornithine antiporter n=1 Tax=Alicyclobacillus ferrooxydans TaxID=471514 RepID=A0A0P9EMI3_9BACL|nr:amino acid permease [Alicyclobacillus ferrooxydans]KPV44585.1 arginine:ornithine antiporter [Alicyclobacillus ferrooxydans]
MKSSIGKGSNLGLWLLTALVVGNMVGSGIFMLPRSLAQVAGPAGVLSAWLLTGAGVLMLALVFGNLAIRKPELSGGVQMYAKSLFRENSQSSTLAGYIVAWGYWAANVAGNVAILTTFVSYLSTFFPIMTSSANLFTIANYPVKVGSFISFLVCSALLWLTHSLILRGIEETGKMNFVATAAKVIGFLIFICFTLFAFEKSNMLPLIQPRLDSNGVHVGLLGQINNAAVTTLWAFVGIESAIMFSARAKNQKDVKRATVLGLIISVIIYIGITLLVMGSLNQHELVNADKPLVDALMKVVGPSASYVMAGFDLVSLAGTTIGWIFLSAEAPHQAAKQGLFPPVFGKANRKGVPVWALTITNSLSQLFIFSVISNTINNAFNFVMLVATLSYLVPYAVSAIYQLKLVISGETYENGKGRVTDGIIAALGTLYSLWVIKAGTSDMKTFLFGVGMLVVGLILYPFVRKRRDRVSSQQTHVNGVLREQG